MKIFTYAARFHADQISRIELGLIELGNEIVDKPEDAQFLYSNDFNHIDQAIEDSKKYHRTYIQNVLDLAPKIWNEKDLENIKNKLVKADILTTISETVQLQIKEKLGLESSIIYQPAKPVSNLNLKKSVEFLLVGRIRDKRGYLAIELINKFKENFPGVRAISVGSEDLNSENILHLGILSDEELNEVYNRSKYVLCFGEAEGLGLVPIEAIITGKTIPICLSDNPTSFEFIPHAFICDPNVESIYNKIQQLDYYYDDLVDGVVKPLSEVYNLKFSPKSVAKNIIDAWADGGESDYTRD